MVMMIFVQFKIIRDDGKDTSEYQKLTIPWESNTILGCFSDLSILFLLLFDNVHFLLLGESAARLLTHFF